MAGLPQHSCVHHVPQDFPSILTTALLTIFGLHSTHEVTANSHLVLDAQQAGVSNFPYVSFVGVLVGNSALQRRVLHGEREVLTDHLKKDRVDMQDGSPWHVKEQGCEGLRNHLSYGSNNLIVVGRLGRTRDVVRLATYLI